LNASSAAVQFRVRVHCGNGVGEGQVDEFAGGLLVGEVSFGLQRLAQLAIERLDRVRIRYETAQASPSFSTTAPAPDGVGSGEYGATIRDRGALRQTWTGRPVSFGGL
jgi:hypothetical protein